MTLVHCKNCGWELRDVDDTPCPNCGDFRRNVSLEGRTQIGLSAKVRTTTSKLEKEIKKNWPLIVVLIVGGIISIIPACFLNGWGSVAASVVFVVFSTIAGYFAITRVIKITIETR